jgi:curli biogenesis system outer membrane secretion channel CsgG
VANFSTEKFMSVYVIKKWQVIDGATDGGQNVVEIEGRAGRLVSWWLSLVDILSVIKLGSRCLAAVLMVSGAMAGTVEYVTVEANGAGATESAAVTEALRACVAQVCGLSISGETNLSIVSAVYASGAEEISLASEKLKSRIETATKGRVSSYEVLAVDKNGATGVEVRISAHIAKYLDPQTQRRRLALVPFRATAAGFLSDGKTLTAAEVTSQLSQALAVNLVSARKFAVLDREYLSEVAREQQLIVSSTSSDADLCKLGALAGADYFVCGAVREFMTAAETLTVPGAGGATAARLTGGVADFGCGDGTDQVRRQSQLPRAVVGRGAVGEHGTV